MSNQNNSNGTNSTVIRGSFKVRITDTKITPCKNYNLHTEIFDKSGQIFGVVGGFEVTSAYTFDKFLIGAPSFATWICDELGIQPEPIKDYDTVCRIGVNPVSNVWYGWDGVELYGFGIGKTLRYRYQLCENITNTEQTCKFEQQIIVLDNSKKQIANSLIEAKQMAIDFALSVELET